MISCILTLFRLLCFSRLPFLVLINIFEESLIHSILRRFLTFFYAVCICNVDNILWLSSQQLLLKFRLFDLWSGITLGSRLFVLLYLYHRRLCLIFNLFFTVRMSSMLCSSSIHGSFSGSSLIIEGLFLSLSLSLLPESVSLPFLLFMFSLCFSLSSSLLSQTFSLGFFLLVADALSFLMSSMFLIFELLLSLFL